MVTYVIRRALYMALVLVLVLVSMIAFLIIQLPPGDYLTVYAANQQALGRDVDQAELAAMGKLYGLDKPVHVQYAIWIWRISRGNLGWSFNLKEKVGTLIADRLPFTVLLSSPRCCSPTCSPSRSASTRPLTSTRSPTFPSRSWGSSAWRRPTSCWR